MYRGINLVILIIFIGTVVYCSKTDDAEEKIEDKKPCIGKIKPVCPFFLKTYEKIASVAYSDAAFEAQELLNAVEKDLTQENNLKDARKKWIQMRKPVLQTQVFLYSSDIGKDFRGKIDAYPVNSDNIELALNSTEDVQAILNAHQENDIRQGHQVIEYLLWSSGAEDKSITKVKSKFSPDSVRANYLRAVTKKLVDDLNTLKQRWKIATPNNLNTREIIQKIKVFFEGKIINGLLKDLTPIKKKLTAKDIPSFYSESTIQDVYFHLHGGNNLVAGKYHYIRSDGEESKVEIEKNKGLKNLMNVGLYNSAMKPSMDKLFKAFEADQFMDEDNVIGLSTTQENIKFTYLDLIAQEKVTVALIKKYTGATLQEYFGIIKMIGIGLGKLLD